jgi:hypothetical protein
MKNLFESFIDVGSGFILALLIQIFIFPFFDLHPDIQTGLKISLIFTIVSILRSWFWRTVFKRI